MTVNTIHFTDIQTDVSQNLLRLNFDYDQDREVQSSLFLQYREQKFLSDTLFNNWLAETNANLIKEIDDFIKHSLGIDGNKNLFEQSRSELIHPASIILGLQATDHGPTLDMIEQHVNHNHSIIKTIRIGAGVTKRSQLVEIFTQPCKKFNLLVMVEQTETMDKFLLESLVSGLYQKLQITKTNCIMILFCMSGSWKSINRLFPITIMNRMIKPTTIVKDTSFIFQDIQSRLIKNEKLIFKLDPGLIHLIDEQFVERDASIMNIKYLYQYALFVHHRGKASLLTLPQKDLTNLLKTHPKLFSELRNLPSLTFNKQTSPPDNPEDFVKCCKKQISHIQSYHKFLIDQLHYWLTLLRDQSKQRFPVGLQDIYEVLFNFDEIGHSPDFVDAINGLHKYTIDGIKRRLSEVFEYRSRLPHHEKENEKDVSNIMLKFLEKLENNGNSKVVIAKFKNKLLEHAKFVINPYMSEFSESIYHERDVEKHAISTSVYYAQKDYTDESTNFGLLYKMIYDSPEEINMNILFCDFCDKYRSLRKKKRKATPNQDTSPSKARKSETWKTRLLKEIDQVQEVIPLDEDEGLIKAIFVDLIDCMEYQGLVKQEKRRSRQDILKKCVWL